MHVKIKIQILNSNSGVPPDQPDSEIYSKVSVPKLKVNVNTESNIQISLLHTQTNGKGLIIMGIYFMRCFFNVKK